MVAHAKAIVRVINSFQLPLSQNVGHRATVYIEEYSLSRGLRAGDAIIAATAAESNLVLCSSNLKHFRPIKDLKLKAFRP
jgi:predicted nucleic acid-binding protein